jgi:hypothetical protein
MNIEIKPFIHQVRFTLPLVSRQLKKKFRRTESGRPVGLPDRRREINVGAAESARYF